MRSARIIAPAGRPLGINHAPIGLIPVDSLYSAVRQVSYKVGAVCRLPTVRPGKRDGGPEDAVAMPTGKEPFCKITRKNGANP